MSRNVTQRCTSQRLVVSIAALYSGGMKRDSSVNVRLTTELKAKLQKLADADGRKLSNYIERVLLAHIQSGEPEASTTAKPKKPKGQ